MSEPRNQGPGGLPLYDLGFPATLPGLGAAGSLHASCSRIAESATAAAFVDAHFEGPDAPRLCVVLDEPSRTASRTAAVLAVASELAARGRRVAVVDGDDHLPDLTRWADRYESEGWIDVVRYDLSVTAAATPLPFADDAAILLGVGSYQPTRATAEELSRLVDLLGETVDHVLVCASTGDRGAVWAVLPSLRVVCWDPSVQMAGNVENMIRDAGLLGEPPRAVLAFAAADEAHAEAPVAMQDDFDLEPPEPGSGSSPVFRRLAILMGVLAVVLAVWWVGQTEWNGGGEERPEVVRVDESQPQVAEPAPAESPAEDHGVRTDAVDTVVAAQPDMTADASDAPPMDESAAAVDAAAIADPFTVDVAADGWCLWVYSLSDSTTAADQLHGLEREGLTGLVRPADVDGRTWYRIYTGSFATAAQARDAMPDLHVRLGTDWAMPVRASSLR